MKNKIIFKKVLSIFTAMSMILSFVVDIPFSEVDFVMTASAADTQTVTIDTDEEVTLSDNDSNGYYEISTADELYAFMELVNAGNDSANAELTADIVVNESLEGTPREWFPIGYCYDRDGDGSAEDIYYTGTFDGNDHTISGLYFNNSEQGCVGLFGQIKGEIKNVGVINSSFSGREYVGGVCGSNQSNGTIKNCYNTGDISGDSNVGGVCGINCGTITNCYSRGTVSGSGNVGGVCGWNYSGTITNCYYDSDVYTGNAVGYDTGTSTDVLGKTTAQFNSGEVAFLLQSGQTADEETGEIPHVWGQEIGVDTYPVLSDDTVYYGYTCTSKTKGYFNEPTQSVPGHKGENGVCIYCGESLECDECHYENGFCTICGIYEQPEAINGVYQIGTVGELYWFMEFVNAGNESANAELTANIVVNKSLDGTPREWFPIGYYYDRDGDESEENICYNGTFDGKNHTISGLYFNNSEQDYVGLFGITYEGALIKNVGIINSYLKGCNNVGGICGRLGNGTIENCYNTGEVAGEENTGGICGITDTATITKCYNTGDINGVKYVGGISGTNFGGTITNCYNTGDISGQERVGGLIGDINYASTTNSYSTGNVIGTTYVGGVCGANYSSTITNCYYLAESETDSKSGTTFKTQAQFASGEVAYLLQGTQEEEVWGQEIGVDAYPVLGGAMVYQHTYKEKTVYTNSAELTGCPHSYENGFCIFCDSYEEPEAIDGVYQIGNAGELYWFMELCNGVEIRYNMGYASYGAVLTADIVVNETLDENSRQWFPIGYCYDRDGDGNEEDVYYKGTFDGKNHTISGLYFNNSEQDKVGLFGQTYEGASIKNVGVINSSFSGSGNVGGVCGINRGTIENCYNEGVVSGGCYVGGVCGSNYSYATIKNCYNTGSVNGTYNQVGGVCGYNYEGTIENCYSKGDVSGSSNVGGVCGWNYDSTITNCYYDSTVYTGAAVGADTGTITNVLGKTTAQFNSGEVAFLLQSGQTADEETGEIPHVWGQEIGVEDYPVLGGKAVILSDETYENTLTANDFTFEAPENLEYDGEKKEAYVTSELDEITIEVIYYDSEGTKLYSAPTEVGEYTVKINVVGTEDYKGMEGLTDDSWKFEIVKVTLEESDFDVPTLYYTYSGEEIPFDVSPLVENTGEIKISYKDYSEGTAVEKICDAGEYTVTVSVAENEYYSATSFELKVTVYQKYISEFVLDIKDPAGGETPQSTVEADGYKGTISWEPDDEAFGYNAEYTATVELEIDDNYYINGNTIAEDFVIQISDDCRKATLTNSYTTAKAKILDVVYPVDVTLKEHCADAQAVIENLPDTMEITAEDKTTSLKISWELEGEEYVVSAHSDNIFKWTADIGDLDNDESGFKMSGTICVTNPGYTDISKEISLSAENITYGENVKIEVSYDEKEVELSYSVDNENFYELSKFEDDNGVLSAGIYIVKAHYIDDTKEGYTITEFQVSQKVITIKPDLNQSKDYGKDEPELTFTNTALVGKDVITGALGREGGEDAGLYAYDIGTLKANDNYILVLEANDKFSIKAIAPDYTKPTNLTATYSEKLSDVELPEGFKWSVAPETAVGEVGENTFMVSFTPEDTKNYTVVENIEVVVKVEQATPTVSPIISEVEYIEGDSLPAIDYESNVEGTIEWTSTGNLVVGENVLEWKFTPEDIKNYETVTGEYTIEAKENISIEINEENFPDEIFREYVKENFDTDGNGALSAEEINTISIDVSDRGISDLKGIEYFTSLTYLNCCNNYLTSLDVSNNTALTSLYYNDNNLTSLDVSNNTALTIISCENNKLTSLDVSNNTALIYLNCCNNNLTSLDLSNNTSLMSEYLYYSNNTYEISLENGTFDLLTLPEGFNLDNVSNWTNATVNGSIITVTDLSKSVTYEYNLGNDKTATFTLNPAIEINEENFPDEIFRNYIKETFDTDRNGVLSATEISGINYINVSKEDEAHENEKISSLKGIEYFTSLTYLNCCNNNLTSLDVSNNTALTTLYCYNNNLTSLDVSNNTALTTLYCYNNNLTSLDVSNNTMLTYLDCTNNNLTSLDVSKNTALTELYCYTNNLTSLDVSNNTVLGYLYCHTNNLTSLDLSKNTALTYLECHNNNLTSLDVSNNTALKKLSCDNNKLTSLDVSKNTALESLNCQINNLTSLDVSNNTSLTTLSCDNNNLTSLDVRNNPLLVNLYCDDFVHIIREDSDIETTTTGDTTTTTTETTTTTVSETTEETTTTTATTDKEDTTSTTTTTVTSKEDSTDTTTTTATTGKEDSTSTTTTTATSKEDSTSTTTTVTTSKEDSTGTTTTTATSKEDSTGTTTTTATSKEDSTDTTTTTATSKEDTTSTTTTTATSKEDSTGTTTTTATSKEDSTGTTTTTATSKEDSTDTITTTATTGKEDSTGTTTTTATTSKEDSTDTTTTATTGKEDSTDTTTTATTGKEDSTYTTTTATTGKEDSTGTTTTTVTTSKEDSTGTTTTTVTTSKEDSTDTTTTTTSKEDSTSTTTTVTTNKEDSTSTTTTTATSKEDSTDTTTTTATSKEDSTSTTTTATTGKEDSTSTTTTTATSKEDSTSTTTTVTTSKEDSTDTTTTTTSKEDSTSTTTTVTTSKEDSTDTTTTTTSKEDSTSTTTTVTSKKDSTGTTTTTVITEEDTSSITTEITTLPQTGYSEIYRIIVMIASLMILSGAFAVVFSRKKDSE